MKSTQVQEEIEKVAQECRIPALTGEQSVFIVHFAFLYIPWDKNMNITGRARP